jgi:2,5-diamino-6-(ribosylamino)-4(3H)-pyrimidinone 5'-phosphate reductase
MPMVTVHIAVSVDGSARGFDPDLKLFYATAASFAEDLTLTGADTILPQEPALGQGPGPDPGAPLLAVVDSRSRVSAWDGLRNAGHWRDVVALRSAESGGDEGPARVIVAGSGRVDLAVALAELARTDRITRVRVDSGGALAASMLAGGLVDELSLLVHPVVTGAGPWLDSPPGALAALELEACERLGDGIVWTRYAVGPAPTT